MVIDKNSSKNLISDKIVDSHVEEDNASQKKKLPVNFDQLIESIRSEYLECPQFSSLSNNKSRVEYLLQQKKAVHLLRDHVVHNFSCVEVASQKNNELARNFLLKAIQYQQENSHHLAISLLHKALLFCDYPIKLRNDNPESEIGSDNSLFIRILVTCAHSCFELGKYSQSENAYSIASQFSTTDLTDLIVWRAASVRMMGDHVGSNQLLAQCLQIVDKQIEDGDLRLQRKRALLSEYKRKISVPLSQNRAGSRPPDDGTHPLTPYQNELDRLAGKNSTKFAHKLVRKMDSGNKGAGLFVTGHLMNDELLLHERPLASIARPEVADSLCAFCLRDLAGHFCLELPVPCDRCADVLYCNNECRKAAWKQFHFFECGYDRKLRETGCIRMAMRLAARDGDFQDSLQIFQKWQIDSQDARLNLVNNANHFSSALIGRQLLAAALYAQYLLHIRHVLGDFTETQEFQLTYLLLHNIQQIAVNSITIYRSVVASWPLEIFSNEHNKQPYAFSQRHTQVGMGIYGRISLVNHSCVPNADVFFFDGDRAQLRARRELRAGEEITISYGPSFIRQARYARKRALLRSHHFECECEACDWPEGNFSSLVQCTSSLPTHLARHIGLSLNRRQHKRISSSTSSLPGDLNRAHSQQTLAYVKADAFRCTRCACAMLVHSGKARCLNTDCSYVDINGDRLLQQYAEAQRHWCSVGKKLSLEDCQVGPYSLNTLKRILWPQNRLLLGAQLECARLAMQNDQAKEALVILQQVCDSNRLLFGERSAETLHTKLDILLLRCKMQLEAHWASEGEMSRALKQANDQWKQFASKSAASKAHLDAPKLSNELRQDLKKVLNDLRLLLINNYFLIKNGQEMPSYILVDGGAISNCLLAYRQIARLCPPGTF